MVRKLLCKLGRHNWRTVTIGEFVPDNMPDIGTTVCQIKCKDCGCILCGYVEQIFKVDKVEDILKEQKPAVAPEAPKEDPWLYCKQCQEKLILKVEVGSGDDVKKKCLLCGATSHIQLKKGKLEVK